MTSTTKGRYHRLPEIYDDDKGQDVNEGYECDCHQKMKLLRRMLGGCIILSCTLAVFILIFGLRLYPGLVRPTIPLGADPWGIVPLEVGQPASWRSFYNDSRDPYWIDEDAFDNLDEFRRVVRRLKWLQNSTNIHANGRTTMYRDFDGKEHVLPWYNGPRSYNLFGIRSFHQIHCIIVMVEDYGLRLHGEPSQWTPGHIMHCINTMRQLVQCMADASIISAIQGSEKHLGDGQQMYCRDFDGLRHWANAPERGVRYRIVSPPGAKEMYEEILPYPGESQPPPDWW
ncbi:hypothetical protein LY78DRAFT_707296 [Colletotrichum sublineola]|uniref:Tat pathway signal sequence n=1 Tax=Colletotrichum sublineola TaxID=1173701 RepID=A0A066XPD0_COLSU|nr:hypothetical protein LY78DRAFT_707296 [Colletotrichum sublineola]KDN71078.1 hypothetical protein CSUB01_10366 [Colletotrichum sublineola]